MNLTPVKKPREDISADVLGVAASQPSEKLLTPDPLSRHAAVTLKTTVNDKLPGPPAGGARAAVKVELLGDNSWWLGKRGEAYAWMDDSVESRSAAIEMRLSKLEKPIVDHLCAKHGEDVVEGVVGANAQTEVALCGRILCEEEGKLNERSLLLEGSRASC